MEKKKSPSRTQNFKPVRLFLDDIKAIVDILQAVTKKVSIETEEYRFASVEELLKLEKESINNLTISCGNWAEIPNIRLSLKPGGTELYIDEDEPVSRGIFEKVKDVLIKCERPHARVLQFAANYLLLVLAMALAPLTFFLPKDFTWSLLAIEWLLIILGLLGGRWARKDRFQRYSIIILKKRVERKSVWERNQDQILLSFA
jgi:hypothetical protein